jgi:hypothetical protein
MNRVYGLLPWGIIGLGVLHMAATWRFYDELTTATLWFFNGGIVLVFTGVLNLINRRDGHRAPALRWFCRAVNVVTLCFATVSGVVGGASAAQMAFVIGLMGAVTLLSLVRLGPSIEQRSNGDL